MTDELTPTQDASRRMAEAVFEDPALRVRFELMAKEMETREPVPDDFAWLPADVQATESSRFRAFARKLLAVPKSAIDAERAKRR